MKIPQNKGANRLISIFVVLMVVVAGFAMLPAAPPEREPMGDDEEEIEARKAAYTELIHRAAPGVNWRTVEEQNMIASYRLRHLFAGKTTTSFAGGAITGQWYERGNNNQAGRMDCFAYLPGTNTLYGMADGGSLWKTPLPTVNWVKVADNMRFRGDVLAAVPITGGTTRLMMSTDTRVWRTDNEGVTYDTATGISFPVAWGGNYIYKIIPVNDAAHSIYCVTFGWDAGSWTARFSLYRSTDSGVSFNYIRNFGYHNSNQLSFCAPLGSATLYALGVSSSAADTLYSVNAGSVSVTNVTTAINSADNLVRMKCVVNGGTTHFYAITGGTHIYHSTNFGANWLLKSTVTASNAIQIGVSAQNPNVLVQGYVDGYRSTDSGASWTIINTWGSYYGDVANKLHADIRDFSFYKYTSGSEFNITGTDGGAYISTDGLATVHNISMSGLRVNQFYDHITHPTDTNILFTGAQDQGLQGNTTAGGNAIFNQDQIISGDYGQLRITGGGNILWPEYPGGWLYLYNNLAAPVYIGNYHLLGTQKPNTGWMLATSDYYTSATQDEILIGGGEITGDSGSYLVRLTLPAGSSTVSEHQYNYNFRINSNSGTSGISAIGISKLSGTLMYVGAEDGTFFYSTNAGTSWTKTPSFAGTSGFYLYGNCIQASPDSVDKVYFAGSGYSNPAVYVSRDHGQTFAPMANGLPPTLVNRLAAYKNDSFLFAATEAGPYVYVKAADTWYSLMDAGLPVTSYRSVEYVAATHTVRFATYGRGVWDLRMKRPDTAVVSVPGVNNNFAESITGGPNPVRAEGYFTFFSRQQGNCDFKLYLSDGRLAGRQTIVLNMPFFLPDLSAGVYIYELSGSTGRKSGLIYITDK